MDLRVSKLLVDAAEAGYRVHITAFEEGVRVGMSKGHAYAEQLISMTIIAAAKMDPLVPVIGVCRDRVDEILALGVRDE